MKKAAIVLKASLLLIAIGLLSNCKKECECHRQPDTDYLIFGKFYGMCFGETCVEIFKIENGNLYEDTTDHYPFSNAPYIGSYVSLSSAQYNLVKNIVDYVPSQLLNEGDTIIGIPDAYDQGGYYLELKDEGETRYWLIDTDKDNIPGYLQAFTDTLNSYTDKLR